MFNLKSYLLIALFLIIGNDIYNNQSITLIEDENILLQLNIKDQSSFIDSQWFSFILTNKSNNRLSIETLDYNINTFSEDENGNSLFNKGIFGSGSKFDLIHYFHNSNDLASDEKAFHLKPNEKLEFWKYAVSKASLTIETMLVKSEEICALIEVDFQYKIEGSKSSLLHNEEVMCTNWNKRNRLESNQIAQFFKYIIKEPSLRNMYTPYLSLMTEMREILDIIDEQIIVDGIISRKNQSNNSERVLLLKALQYKEALANNNLKEHYRNCIQDKYCYWEPDFYIYWNNELLEVFLESKVFANTKATLLEMHSEEWSDSDTLKNIIYNYLVSAYNFDFNQEINKINFTNWYNKIKNLSVSRHSNVIDYLIPLLENKTFYPIEDWSNFDSRKIISENDKDKAKIIYFRVCDVAFVSLLRALDQIQLKNIFTRNKLNPELYIDKKWRGFNENAKKSIRIVKPYTVLSPNLKMAEKYYYLDQENIKALNLLIKQYKGHKNEK